MGNSKQSNWFGFNNLFNNLFSLTRYGMRALCQQFGLFMAWILLKIPFCMALEGHGVFVEKFNEPWWAKCFSTDFDNWVTKVNSGIGTEVIQEGKQMHWFYDVKLI